MTTGNPPHDIVHNFVPPSNVVGIGSNVSVDVDAEDFVIGQEIACQFVPRADHPSIGGRRDLVSLYNREQMIKGEQNRI